MNEGKKSVLEVELAEIKKELEQKSKEELIEELAVYRLAVPKMGPAVTWFINNLYKPVFVRWRMGREAVGLLVAAVYEPKELHLLTQEEMRDYFKKTVTYQQRFVIAPTKELQYYDVLLWESEPEKYE